MGENAAKRRPSPSGRARKRPALSPAPRRRRPPPDPEGESPAAAPAFPIVGVGASAGGLEAFTQLLAHIPEDSGMAFVFIQHLDPNHASLLDESLARATRLKVRRAENGMPVKPDEVYVIPPDADLGIAAGRLTLQPRQSRDRGSHLPIDAFFRSLAAEHHNRAIGVVLSGTASDGTEGLRAIKAEDGITFAQDPRSAKFGGMPDSAVQAGVVDHCLPIPRLAQAILRLGGHPYLTARTTTWPESDDRTFRQILELVDKTVGVNFAEHKRPTLERRLNRRMAVRGLDSVATYLALLKREPAEVRALYEDILIHVTSLFRDPEMFQLLRAQVFPEILAGKSEDTPVRLWVPGCSTGEEVYSLAICLLEHLQENNRTHPIQIFGSDISDWAVQRARAGVYPETVLRDLSEKRRRSYFSKVEGGFRISKAVRDLCVFVRHDLARDPPFSKVDLVSCRNVLIYLDQPLQKRVLPMFHYCLNQPGFLVLGRAENVAGFNQLFVPVDKGHKIFARTSMASRLRFAPRRERHPTVASRLEMAESGPAARPVDLAKHVDSMLLNRYAPPGVVVNDRLEILQFRGKTGSYLQPAPGEPQTNVVKMARDGLLSALRATIARAKQSKAPARAEGVEVDQEGFVRRCDLLVIPMSGLTETAERLYIVLFEPAAEAAAGRPKDGERQAGKRPRSRPKPAAESSTTFKLEHELLATREYLQSLTEEHGRTNDELAAANAELVSGNEELQSMNEELETAKEELQSTNEELTTVNDELHSRNQEMNVLNNDLINLLGTVDVPILILDPELRIRRFTPKSRSILNILPSDVGRPIGDIKPNIDVPDLEQQVAEVIREVKLKESEVQDREGRWYRMQIRPYLAADERVDGAVLSLVDIDALKHHVSEAQLARVDSERANRAKDQFLATLSHELRTPLSTMLIHAQRLAGGAVEADQVRRTGEAIERGTRLQVQLIDDLLDVSRIVSGKLRMRWRAVSLVEVIRSALESVNAQAERKAIRFKVTLAEDVEPVYGDATRLQQVFWNLLNNAIKFSAEGGEVIVTLETAGGQARVRVSDQGVGIDPEFLPRMWSHFTQEDSSNARGYGGLGLGLAIVQHLVQVHGGTVSAESAGKNQGATFWVTIPVSSAHLQHPRSEVSPSLHPGSPDGNGTDTRRLRGLKVLLVDDDAGLREAVAALLAGTGAVVRSAGSAEEALATLTEFAPDILLSDIAMPGEDGYSLIRRVRALGAEQGGNVPAIALTALAGENDRQRVLAAGFQGYLSKPVDLDHLAEALLGQAPTA